MEQLSRDSRSRACACVAYDRGDTPRVRLEEKGNFLKYEWIPNSAYEGMVFLRSAIRDILESF
jgi:hypothetical protein